jgi:hypothetical protein
MLALAAQPAGRTLPMLPPAPPPPPPPAPPLPVLLHAAALAAHDPSEQTNWVDEQPHALDEQICVAPQTLPHMPQFEALMVVSTQVEPHRVWPMGQPHWLLLQLRPAPHCMPHWPQFWSLVTRSTQA